MNNNSNDTSFISQSSKENKQINISLNNDAEKNNQKNQNNQKKNQNPVSILKVKKNSNNFLSLYPRQNERLKNSVLSSNPTLDNNNKIKHTLIQTQHPFRNSNKNLFNIWNHQKKSNIIGRQKLSLGDTQHFMHRRNSHQIEFPRRNSKKNLKQIQRELQYKLLDMSIQIENDSDNDDNHTEFNIQRNEKKRFTEYPKKKHISFKKMKSGDTYISSSNINLGTGIGSELKKGKTTKISTNNEITKPKPKIAGRRQSYMPKSFLINKFEKNTQQNNEKLNLSVNMNLYRDLIPHIDLSEQELTNINNNINNKSMLITKKKINIKKILLYSLKNEEFENKYRLLMRQKELYDSYEDEEVIEELEDEYFFISPETHQIFIFDTLILLCTLFGSFYLPIYIAQSKCFCSYIPKAIKIILFFQEFINIIDIIISFFRAYYNFEFVLIKKNDRIVWHYLKKYFFTDLLCAIPFFSISYYFCNHYETKPDGVICLYNGVDLKYNFIKMAFGFKIIKLLKVMNKKVNRGINYFYEVISENYTLEKSMKMLLFAMMCTIGFNFFICYHIYIGLQSYPNWILKTNNQDASFITLYLTSFYFLITTITSVGYGDITCVALSETLYQIVILTIGVIAYSWIVSTIGNYVKKETRAAIKFNKDLSILEEIRISYPKMSFKLYNKIHKHLETVSHQQEKLDTNLLVTNLPYTLKNQIMFIIYGSIIKKFKFFKECENSDFILRVLTSFIPLSTKKGAFIIQEGEIIDNIVFVREGRLSLVATIDLDNPLISIDNYLGEKFEDINEKYNTKLDNSSNGDNSVNMGIIKKEKASTVLKTFLKTKEDIEEENIEQEIAKKDFNGEDIEIGNMQFLNILDILKNEHYGIVYMFLKKPSPLSLRVKSKYSQLFLLRKNDTMQISKAYPNVWKKIYYKSYHNMKSIKKMTKKVVINYCQNYGHKYNFDHIDDLDSSKQETDFFFKLGILNSRKRENTQKRIAFNLEGNHPSNQNVTKPKSILKHNKNEMLGLNSNVIGLQSYRTDKYPLMKNFPVNTSQMNNPIALTQAKPNTNIKNNISFFTSKNLLSGLGEDVAKTRVNQINQINNNINYNIVINDIDLNNDSKTLLKSEENKNQSFMKKSIRNMGSITNGDKDNTKRPSNFMQNVPMKIKGLSSLNSSRNNNINVNSNLNTNLNPNLNSINNMQYQPPNNLNINIPNNTNDFNRIVTLNIPKENNNKNLNENIARDNTLEINSTDEKKSESSPNTINDLSKSLLKKVKKKIKKRRKRKKLYKMLIQKITESIAKVNPNINLSSSMNNNSLILSSKIGDVFALNPELNYIIDEKPELNPNSSKSINHNLTENMNNNINSNINNLNQNPFYFPQQHQEFVNIPNPQELFLIPESLELSSSETSSENSSNSDNTSKNNNEEKNSNSNKTQKKDKNKSTTENPPKKELILSISTNTNFTLKTTYDNLNTLSEGNYSKDENLQKSVLKLIKVYLSEKEKEKEKINEKIEIEKKPKNATSVIDGRSSIVKSPKLKDNLKEEKKEEKDVWSFLNDDEDSKKENTKTDDSFEKGHCKSPQMRKKKTNFYTRKRKTKRIYDNLFSLDETPKHKKTYNKKKGRNINKTTYKKDIKVKKSRKKNNQQILNLHTLEKEEDEGDHKDKDKNKEKNSDKEKDKDKEVISSSLDLSDFDEGLEQKESYVKKNYYKTYQKKDNKKEKEFDDASDDNADNNNENSKEGA